MQPEGETQAIALRGIERAGADTVISDGALEQCVGFRHKDGSLVPYLPELHQSALIPDNAVAVRAHSTSTQTNILYIDNTGNLYWTPLDDFDDNDCTWNQVPVTGVTEIEFVGNLLMTQTTQCALWNGTEYGKFNHMPHEWTLPQLDLRVAVPQQWETDKDDAIGKKRLLFLTKLQSSEIPDEKTDWDICEGNAQALLSKWADLGGLTGYCFAVVAYRLKDGTYIKASQPVLLSEPKITREEYEITGNIIPNDLATPDSGCTLNYKIYFDTNGLLQTHSNYNYLLIGGNTDFIINGYNHSGSSVTVEPDKNSEFIIYTARLNKGDDWYYVSVANANELQYRINTDIDESLKNTIDCVCVFLSKQVQPFHLRNYDYKNTVSGVTLDSGQINEDKVYISNFRYQHKKREELLDELKANYLFYKVHEIPFDEIKDTNGWQKINLEGKLGDSLTLQTSLSITAFQNAEITDSHLFAFNQRFHLFDYTQIPSVLDDLSNNFFWGGVGQHELTDLQQNTYVYWKVIAKCRNDSRGEYILQSEGRSQEMTNSFALNPLVVYPNQDAYEVEIRVAFSREEYITTDTDYYRLVIPLNKWKELGVAYNIRIDNDLTITTKHLHPYILTDFTHLEYGNEGYENYPMRRSENTPFRYRNHIKVSDVAYPTFPPSQTYMVGKGTIIGLTVLTQNIAQYTFGKYPVICFATDGIYALEIDLTAETVYKTITSTGLDSALSRNVICHIGGMIVFASSKGLMQLTTDENVKQFAPLLNGEVRHLPDTTYIGGYGLKILGDAIAHNQLSGFANGFTEAVTYINQNDIKTDLSHELTHIRYAQDIHGLVIYNSQWNYHYIVDIETLRTSVIPIKIIESFFCINNRRFIDADRATRMFTQDGQDTQLFCFLQTRPIKLKGAFKSITRCALRGRFFRNAGMLAGGEGTSLGLTAYHAGLYLLGSLDGERWLPIGFKQKQLNDFIDMGCVADRTAVKYVMAALVGQFRKRTHIDGLEITFKNKYNNKLK